MWGFVMIHIYEYNFQFLLKIIAGKYVNNPLSGTDWYKTNVNKILVKIEVLTKMVENSYKNVWRYCNYLILSLTLLSMAKINCRRLFAICVGKSEGIKENVWAEVVQFISFKLPVPFQGYVN